MMSDNAERMAQTEIDMLREQHDVARAKVKTVVGPFGKMYPIHKFTSMTYGFKDPNRHLSAPEALLKEGVLEPGMHLAWPVADDDATRAKLRDGHYIRVKPDELDQHTGLAISTHKGTNARDEVRWYRHVLVKIPSAAWDELYEMPVAYSMTRLDSEVEAFKDKVEEISKGGAKPTVEIGVDTGPQ